MAVVTFFEFIRFVDEETNANESTCDCASDIKPSAADVTTGSFVVGTAIAASISFILR